MKSATPILLAALLGLGLGWWLFHGRRPDPLVIHEVHETLADTARARRVQDSLVTIIGHLMTSKNASIVRERRRSDSLTALLPGLQTSADSVPVLVAALASVTAQRDSGDSARARLMDAFTIYADSMKAERGRLIAALADAGHELERVNVPPRRPWAAGVVLSERGTPVGGMVSRDVLGRLTLSAAPVREPVAGGYDSRVYFVAQVRF